MAQVAPLRNTVSLDECSHVFDLNGFNKLQPKSLTDARIQYLNLFRKWIQNYKKFEGISDDYDSYLASIKFS